MGETIETQPSKSGMSTILALLVIVGIGIGLWYYTMRPQSASYQASNSATASNTQTKTSSNATSTQTSSTNDQIFQEVANQFGLTRERLFSFTIYGSDKVIFHEIEPGGGVVGTFAYKTSNSWKVALKGGQAPPLCSEIANIPDNYKPACYPNGSDQLLYSTPLPDGGSENSNYPSSLAIVYIAEPK